MSEWYKLLNEIPQPFYKQLGTYGYYYEAGSVERWVEKIKAEGDKLKEKAEKWDILDPEEKGFDSLIDALNQLSMYKYKLKAIQSLGLVSLITDMTEDLMAHYNHWQKNRDFEGYHKPVKNSDMRAVRKYMEDFRAINKKLKELLGK